MTQAALDRVRRASVPVSPDHRDVPPAGGGCTRSRADVRLDAGMVPGQYDVHNARHRES